VLESNIIGIGKNNNEDMALQEAVSYLPWDNFINSSHRETITVNLVNLNPPEKAVTVGQETLRTLIRLIKEKKPKKITVAAGSGGASTMQVYKEYGYNRIIEEEGVEFADLNSGDFSEINLKHDIVKSTKINKLIHETDVLVSFTQLKFHEEATVSASIKNMALSWPPADVHGYPKKSLGIHEDLHGFIWAMAEEIPIDLAVVSLNPAMIGTGPSKGIPIHTGMVIAGLDAVAVDTVCARLLGFRPQAVNYLFRLIKSGISQGNMDNIDLKGMTLIEAEKYFSYLAYGKEFSIDE
jgi:uncharacterized protein (DUF362 family)